MKQQQPEYQLTTWNHGLFGCLGTRGCGCDCCCAHLGCFQPWTLHNATRLVGIDDGNAALIGTVAALTDNTAFDVAAACTRGPVRGELSRRLFARDIYDVDVVSPVFVHCCCGPCASVQEVDSVLAWAYAVHGKTLVYGNCFPRCQCTKFVDVTTGRVVDGPLTTPLIPAVPLRMDGRG